MEPNLNRKQDNELILDVLDEIWQSQRDVLALLVGEREENSQKLSRAQKNLEVYPLSSRLSSSEQDVFTWADGLSHRLLQKLR